MSRQVLHQLLPAAAAGDAITDQALLLQSWARAAGYAGELYADHLEPALEGQIRPLEAFRQPAAPVIYHHSFGAELADRLREQGTPLLLIYHNVTPASFLAATDPVAAGRARQGATQLRQLAAQTRLALADSAYNEADLRQAGYGQTGVLPLALDEAAYRRPVNPALLARLRQRGPNLLFVGRITPNKRQEDLVRLLYYYRQLRPEARLLLVGRPWLPAYAAWLARLIAELDLSDGVVLTGQCSHQDLLTYFQGADLYVSMSEHEGFGKPLVESMLLGLPVLAYAAGAVPETLGPAGVLFHRKAFPALAELTDLLIDDSRLRQALIAGQRDRVQTFLAPRVRPVWLAYLAQLFTV